MHLPKITLITPSYNQGQYIEQTITSVLDQNYPNLEYIIIDGGSSDGTVDIIKKYEKHLAYWISEPDRGQAHAIKKGLAKATGEVFNWLNSDDYLEPGSLQAIGEYFTQYPQTEVFCGYTHCFFEETGKASHTYRMGIKHSPAATLYNFAMNQPGTFYSLPWVKQAGGINESLRYVFDDELWFRYLCARGQANIYLSDALIAHFRLHETSKSVGEGYSQFGREINAIFYYLGQQLQFPQPLLQAMQKLPMVNDYRPGKWYFSALNSEELLAWFCNTHQFTLYKDFYYLEARQCARLVKKYNIPVKQPEFSKQYAKLFLIPHRMLTWVRNKKFGSNS